MRYLGHPSGNPVRRNPPAKRQSIHDYYAEIVPALKDTDAPPLAPGLWCSTLSAAEEGVPCGHGFWCFAMYQARSLSRNGQSVPDGIEAEMVFHLVPEVLAEAG
jgi:hypothetical protein